MPSRFVFAPGEIDAIAVDFSDVLAEKDRILGLTPGTVEIQSRDVTSERSNVTIGSTSATTTEVLAWIDASDAEADDEDLVRVEITTTHGHVIVQKIQIAIC